MIYLHVFVSFELRVLFFQVSCAHAKIQSRQPAIQELQLPTSSRLGPTLIHCLQDLFPKQHNDLQAAGTHEPLLLPVVFNELSYFCNSDQERNFQWRPGQKAMLRNGPKATLRNGPKAMLEPR